jgi:hypothetical protein
MISRRRFLSILGLSLAHGFLSSFPKPSGAASFPQFSFTQIRYRGGEWDPNPQFVEAIVEELELRTSIDALNERRILPYPTLISSVPPLYCWEVCLEPSLHPRGKY